MRKLYHKYAEAAGGQVYSLDKVVQNFTLRYSSVEKEIDGVSSGQALLDGIAGMAALEYRHWVTYKMGTYRDQFSISTDTGGSFWLGVGLNVFGKKPEFRKCRLEWNPNKVGYTREFVAVFNLVMSLAKYSDVKQFDLAIDIPIERSNVSLCKDGRLYEELARSRSDRTQYVGQRNAAGRVKVYNKTVEAKLSEPVTRVEITLAMDDVTGGQLDGWAAVKARFPTVYLMGDIQVGEDVAKLNDTDLFIFRTLLDAPERLPELGRRLREKHRLLLEQAGCVLKFDGLAFGKVVDILGEYMQLLPNLGLPVFERKFYDVYENEIEEMYRL